MIRPLYHDSTSNYEPGCSHTGLWYDKFCDQWQTGWTLPAQQKAEWIKQVASDRPVGDQSLISQHVDRQKDLVEKTLNGVCVQLHSQSRFVTGLGQEHPVENGFAWHPTLGIPYLPGASIKGLLRAWARDWWANDVEGEDRKKRLAQIDAVLGNQDSVGAIIIFDSLPRQSVRLEADVMTPHYDAYYQHGAMPGDWISPVPIPYLVVAAGTPFQFSFAPRTPAAKEYLPIVEDWLKAALQWLGVGAKTSVGYGRFGETATKPVATQEKENEAVKGPRYGKGDIVTATRIEDPKPKRGKSRTWFVADDGFGGVVTQGTPPDIQIGETAELKVAAILQHGGYNFAVPK